MKTRLPMEVKRRTGEEARFFFLLLDQIYKRRRRNLISVIQVPVIVILENCWRLSQRWTYKKMTQILLLQMMILQMVMTKKLGKQSLSPGGNLIQNLESSQRQDPIFVVLK